MPFYKKDSNDLLVAPNFVINASYELHAESHAEHDYPIDGWHWFDTDDEAVAALGPFQLADDPT